MYICGCYDQPVHNRTRFGENVVRVVVEMIFFSSILPSGLDSGPTTFMLSSSSAPVLFLGHLSNSIDSCFIPSSGYAFL